MLSAPKKKKNYSHQVVGTLSLASGSADHETFISRVELNASSILDSSNPYRTVLCCMKKRFRCCAFHSFIFPFEDGTSFAAPPLAAFLWRPQCGCVSLAVIPAARRWEAKPCWLILLNFINQRLLSNSQAPPGSTTSKQPGQLRLLRGITVSCQRTNAWGSNIRNHANSITGPQSI